MQSAAEQAPTHQGAPAGGLTSHPGSLRPTEIPEGPEIETRRGLDPISAVVERTQPHLVRVECQNLSLRIALFDVKRVVDLAQFPFPALFSAKASRAERDVPGQLHGDRAAAGSSKVAPHDVLGHRDDKPRDVEADVLEEVAVFGRDDGVSQHGRDVVVTDDHASLGRKLPDEFATAGRRVIVPGL